MFRVVKVKRRDRGAGLIEVLVAVLVLAVGLLGLAGLQVSAMQNGQSSYLRSQASLMAYSLIDQARAQGGRLSAADITAWQAQLPAVLPGGTGTGVINTSAEITVAITWLDAHWNSSPAEAEEGEEAPEDTRKSTFSITSRL